MKVRFYTKGRRRRYPSAAFRMAGAVSSETLLCTEDFQELLFALEFFGILVRLYQHHAPYDILVAASVIIVFQQFSGQSCFGDYFCA